MGKTLITAPTSEPVSVIETKAALKIDVDDDDGLIAGYILAARDAAEVFTRRKLFTQTWDITYDRTWPCERIPGYAYPRPRIVLPFPPLQSVTHVKYYDTAGVEQTLAADQYRVDPTSYEGRIEPAYGVTWPTVRDMMSTITVRTVVGFSTLPESIRLALYYMVGHYYANRESVVIGTITSEVPNTAQALLQPYRSFY